MVYTTCSTGNRALKRQMILSALGNVENDETTKVVPSNSESDLDFTIVQNNDEIDDLTPIEDINDFKEILCLWTYEKPCEQVLNWL